ncbi:ankyrin repeat-containing domain protein [Trichoderma chlorosporum]
MDRSRNILSNTIGDNSYIAQGDVINNHYIHGNAEGQEENDLLRRLYQSPYEDRKNRNPPRIPGTCDWFVSHEHFRAWNESDSSSMLWVSADPGCGKSVLVRHLVDSIVQTTESRTVCYFFFKDDFPDQKSVTSALCCILRQIFIQKPSLLSKAILKKFSTGGETFNTSFSELWQTLIQVVEDENAGEIICLLDAIDECEDQVERGRSQLLDALCTLYGTKRTFNLNFLLTSRPYVGIYRGLQPLQIPGLPVIHLSGESEEEMKKISTEIATYISARVQDIRKRLKLSQSESNLLLNKLMEVPNRTYLWVYLVLDLVENSIHLSEVMIAEVTSNIPTTIDEAYDRILSKSLDSSQAKRVLHIVVAASRPLTLREMNFALALSEGAQSYDDLGLLPEDRFRDNLRNTCGLCVTVIDSKIYLLHQTLKEFLVERDEMPPRSDGKICEWKYSLQPKDSHRILAKICIEHLLAESKLKSASSPSNTWQSIFLDYSAKYWASHFRETNDDTQSLMTESILEICDVDGSCCKTWFKIYWTTTDTQFPGKFTTLMIASYFGLRFAVQSLLKLGKLDLNAQDETYRRSALSWAVRNGFRLVAQMLIRGIYHKIGSFRLPPRKKAKIDLQDTYGRAPLAYAVWNGDVALVRLLIEAGAREDLKDKLEGTPLSYAFCNGNNHIIDLLTKKKRRSDVQSDIDTLLYSAAREGHEEVVRLLLKTGRANMTTKDPNGWTPLIISAEKGHEAVAKLLLKAGADVNAHDHRGSTALKWASSRGHEAVMKLLLEAGADVNAQDNNGRTALMLASYSGDEAVAKLLLETGADVDAEDDDGRTALIWASYSGNEAVTKLLLETGADVNAEDDNGRTALMSASRRGHEAVTKLLLEAGAQSSILATLLGF